MPVTQTLLTSGVNDVDASSSATASITPSANKLILVAVGHVITTVGSAVATPTLSGNGLTWVQVATVTYQLASGFHVVRLTVFRAMGAAPSAGAITIAFGGQSQRRCLWAISEFSSVDGGGTNGSAAVVQSVASGGGDSSNVTSGTVTLAAFGSADNATFGAFYPAGDLNNAITPGTGFAEIVEVASGEYGNLATEWRNDNDTSVDTSWATADYWGGVAVEIKFALAITGTAVVTLPSVTASATGQQTHAGTAAATLPSLTAAATGYQFWGTAAVTLPSLTASATGTQTHSGTAAATLPSLTAAASGLQTHSGTAAATLPSLMAAASGAQTYAGTAALTLPSLTAAATGQQTHSGTAVCTLPSLTASAQGLLNKLTLSLTGSAATAISVTGSADTAIGITGSDGANIAVGGKVG